MYCMFCGSEIPDDSKFCKSCGKKLTARATTKNPIEFAALKRKPSVLTGKKAGKEDIKKSIEKQKTLLVLAVMAFFISTAGMIIAYFYLR